ncbi:MAG: hypothetical protein IJP16_10250 [Clostridia bacterium]|nr:hypothetical protein [Clostridia bacterium]
MDSISQHDFTKRIFGKKRYFKQIDKKEFHFLFDTSPLELEEAVEVYDIESLEYFLSIRFARITNKLIRSFKIRLFLYLDSPLPYKKLSYIYNVNKKKMSERLLGADDYIPIPETYFKRYEIFIDEVTYEDGTVEALSCSTVDKRSAVREAHVAEMDSAITPSHKSEKHPAVIMPQFSEGAWICTCSQKNTPDLDICKRCGRLKADLEKMVTMNTASEFDSDPYSFVQRAKRVEHTLARTATESSAEKETAIENEMKKVEKREKYKSRMVMQALPRIALYFIAGYLIYLFLVWLERL